MTWATPYFSRKEFACKCDCGYDTVDYALVSALTAIREHFGQPVTITSACRCDSHNRAEGGSTGSQHKLGRAADIVVRDVPPNVVADLAESMSLGGVGRYDTFTHIDTRHGKARWGD